MIRKMAKRQQEERQLEWPESFYGVTDKEARRRALEARMDQGEELEDNRLRMELWERRYARRGKDPQGVDYFIRAWLSLKYIYNNRKSFFYGRRMAKDMLQASRELCLDWADEPGSRKEQLIYDEMYHLGKSYIELCLSDKSYSSLIMGMGQMKESSLHNKIGQEIRELAYELPKTAGLEKEFRVLTQAVTDCYNEKFPNSSVRLEA